VNNNGTYDVSYSHGGLEQRVPAHLVRPKDKSDQIEEFVAVWLWKPNGKDTEDELTLLSNKNICRKSSGSAVVGDWKVIEPKGGGRNIVKLAFSGEVNSIEMERISLTTLRAKETPHRAVLKQNNGDCLHVEYFGYKAGVLGDKPPVLLGRKPDVVRREQQVSWEVTSEPWVGLPESFAENFAARWKGLIEISKKGEYKFKLDADTGATLYLNDKLLLAASSMNPEENEVCCSLNAGQQRMVIDYFCKASDTKMIRLSYLGPDTGDEEWAVVPVAVLQHSKEQAELVASPASLQSISPTN
jgi:hypothetical protein